MRIIFILIFINISNLFCQIKLVPLMGLSSFRNQIETSNDFIKSRISKPYAVFGLGAQIKYKQGYVDAYAISNFIGYQIRVNNPNLSKFQNHQSGYFHSKGNTIFGLRYFYGSFKIRELIKIPNIKYEGNAIILNEYQKNNPKHLLVFNIQPYTGIFLSYQPKQYFNFDSTSQIKNGTLDGVNFSINEGNINNPIILNSISRGIQLGIKIQFYSKNKERLAIHFEYNQGLIAVLKANVEYKLISNSNWESTSIISRGGNFSIYASYPITLVNKKGERYRDRHPKD